MIYNNGGDGYRVEGFIWVSVESSVFLMFTAKFRKQEPLIALVLLVPTRRKSNMPF